MGYWILGRKCMIECDFGGLWAHVCMSLLKRLMGDLSMEGGGYLDEEKWWIFSQNCCFSYRHFSEMMTDGRLWIFSQKSLLLSWHNRPLSIHKRRMKFVVRVMLKIQTADMISNHWLLVNEKVILVVSLDENQ